MRQIRTGAEGVMIASSDWGCSVCGEIEVDHGYSLQNRSWDSDWVGSCANVGPLCVCVCWGK